VWHRAEENEVDIVRRRFLFSAAKTFSGVSAGAVASVQKDASIDTATNYVPVILYSSSRPQSHRMDIEAGDSPWGGKDFPTASEFRQLTSKMFRRTQKIPRPPKVRTMFHRVRTVWPNA